MYHVAYMVGEHRGAKYTCVRRFRRFAGGSGHNGGEKRNVLIAYCCI